MNVEPNPASPEQSSGSTQPPSVFTFLIRFFGGLIPAIDRFGPETIWRNPLQRAIVQGVFVGVAIMLVGFVGITVSWLQGRGTSSVFLTVLGFGAAVYLIGSTLLRLSRISVKSDEPAPTLDTLRNVEQIRLDQQRAEEAAFTRNRQDVFVLQAFELTKVRFFSDLRYPFAPRVNVLLGKNGYGKTLLLRSLAAMIQGDAVYSKPLFPNPANADARLRLLLTRNGKTEETVRDQLFFQKSAGGVPLLAIPDSRFVNRSQPAAGLSSVENLELWRSGARNFLTQEPYENVIQEFLYELGLNFLESGAKKPEDYPPLGLLQNVVAALTENHEFTFSRIERFGRTGFRFWVKSAGTQGEDVPLQYASQGTLSVLAIFGLIYSFLHSLRPDASHTGILATPAIVFIDEIDAHLHPSWQQLIVAILTGTFPNVQFILSAHSPLIVSGCDRGEVAVLRRKDSKGLSIEILDHRDFMGTSYNELYDDLFDVDDVNRLYWQYSREATTGKDRDVARDIERLEGKQRRTPEDELQLIELRQHKRLIQRAAEVRDAKLKKIEAEARVEALEDEVKQLRAELSRKNEGSTDAGLLA